MGILVRVLAIVLLTLAPALAYAKTPASTSTAATKSTKTVKAKKATKGKAAARPPVTAGYLAPHYSSIVVDADTAHVLSEADADSPSHPASLTKMMTLYLLFGALDRGEVRMTTKLKASAHAVAQGRSKLNIPKGKTITVDQAIDAIVTLSANDVAVMIAEQLGGTEDEFADQMTSVAHKLGMTTTVFANASGLPHPNQITTARDMAVLAKRLMTDFPQYYPLFSRTDFAYAGATIHTHNHLLDPNLNVYYEGADGIKTGYTNASGFNLTSSAKRGKHRIIAVVLGGASAGQRDRHMVDLMDDGFEILNGHPERAVAGRRIEAFGDMQIANLIHESEEEAESAGDKEEKAYTPPPKRAVIAAEALPAPPPSQERAVPAPVLKADNTPVPRANARTANDDGVPAPVPQEREKPVAAAKAPAKDPKVASLPRNTTAAPSAGGWGIQIGAFASSATAQAQAEAAVAKLQSTFAAATAAVQRVTVQGKAMYRARVQGLPQTELVKACALIGKAAKGGCQAVPPDGMKAG